ncbi:SOS response-associated peptidase [Mucilaginibacter ginkgonis]|uniref:Abasic site processing protein n=1 Tax=Mucilaginibacter ginkgonis TaxID=2682091 RepID=A0A6I4I574_9SPHI|nr:SOS response-associated peptidase [Mucilaginibacter ginkgonis]QQL49207.1 SOS response-associated peptidase [Mucilaginibacter ginkgonis]
MCGRVLISEIKGGTEQTGIRGEAGQSKAGKSGNPGSMLPVVTDAMPTKVQYYRWGLLRTWDNEIHSRYKHARVETLQNLPTFKDLVGHNHCVTKVDGYFEFNRASKELYYITNADGSPLYLAGLWDIWMDIDTNVLIPTFTMITTEPNAAISEIHDRMPVMLKRSEVSTWLNSRLPVQQRLALLQQPYTAELKICLASERDK